jgi:hypothetical protein
MVIRRQTESAEQLLKPPEYRACALIQGRERLRGTVRWRRVTMVDCTANLPCSLIRA